MSWPIYRDYTSGAQRQIALASLSLLLFNVGRCPSNFFDFSRTIAVGPFSDVLPYLSFVRQGVDGLLLPNYPALWVQAIVELRANAAAREHGGASSRVRAGVLMVMVDTGHDPT